MNITRLLLLPLLAACQPAFVLDDTKASGAEADTDTDTDADTDTDTDTDADADTDSDADTDTDTDTDTEPEPDLDGTWIGEVEVEIYWRAWDWGDSCEGDAELVIRNGRVEGEMGCRMREADLSFEFFVEGDEELNGDGLVLLNDGVREDETSWEGEESRGDISGYAEGTMTAYGEDMTYSLSFEVER